MVYLKTGLIDKDQDLKNQYEYSGFGNILLETGPKWNNFMFTSREYEKSADLYYFRSRYYDPKVGRFTQKDKFTDFNDKIPLDYNFYIYVKNSPFNFIDPSGNFGGAGVTAACIIRYVVIPICLGFMVISKTECKPVRRKKENCPYSKIAIAEKSYWTGKWYLKCYYEGYKSIRIPLSFGSDCPSEIEVTYYSP